MKRKSWLTALMLVAYFSLTSVFFNNYSAAQATYPENYDIHRWSELMPQVDSLAPPLFRNAEVIVIGQIIGLRSVSREDNSPVPLYSGGSKIQFDVWALEGSYLAPEVWNRYHAQQSFTFYSLGSWQSLCIGDTVVAYANVSMTDSCLWGVYRKFTLK